jgi:hypothetical protein
MKNKNIDKIKLINKWRKAPQRLVVLEAKETGCKRTENESGEIRIAKRFFW